MFVGVGVGVDVLVGVGVGVLVGVGVDVLVGVNVPVGIGEVHLGGTNTKYRTMPIRAHASTITRISVPVMGLPDYGRPDR